MRLKKTKLSVNINKVATLRNARGKNIPDLISIAKLILKTKACGLTVHPRPDERHIRYKDLPLLKKLLKLYPNKELNIEGYPSQRFLKMITQIRPQQCTLVPDPPEVLTSNAGWDFVKHKSLLKSTVKKLTALKIRSSLFLDPLTIDKQHYLALKEIKPRRIELYTESYAKHWGSKKQKQILSLYKKTALKLKTLNIQVNAGHDLNHQNLFDLLKNIPEIKEVSIGQALIALALELGLNSVIKKYLTVIDQAFA